MVSTAAGKRGLMILWKRVCFSMLKVMRYVTLLMICACIISMGINYQIEVQAAAVPTQMKVPPPSNGGALKIAELVNEERAKQGLRPVKFYALSPVQKAARIRAGEIRQRFEHIRLDNSQWYTVLDGLNINYSAAGENIGHASNMKPETVMQMWMASPEHRANILNPDYNMMGVGCAWSPSLNVYSWTQIFLETDDANKNFVDLLPLYAEDIKSLHLNPGVDIDGLIAKNISNLKDASRSISAGDTSVRQYMIMGHANKFLGNYLGARESFFKALQADSSNVNVYVAIAETFDLYDIQKRMTWLQKGEALGVRNSELYAALAQTYSKLNQDEKALYYANLAVEANPNSNIAIQTRKNILEFQEFKRKNKR